MYEDLLEKQEIIAWWSAERGRIDRECRAQEDRVRGRAFAGVDALSMRQLFFPSAERKVVERRIESDINMFNRRMVRALHESCAVSLQRIEGTRRFDGQGHDEASAALALGGAMGIGSVGVAAMATGAATTVSASTILGLLTFGTVATFSWPVFTAFAVGSATLAVGSGGMANWAAERRRRGFKSHIVRTVREALVRAAPGAETASTREALLAAVDRARDLRLQGRPE